MSSVSTGLDSLIRSQFKKLAGKKVGILANQSSVALCGDRFCHLVDLLHDSGKCTIQRVFAPEHGFRGELQDMETIADVVDKRTGIPIVSLYGSSIETLKPKSSDLQDLDVLVVDLPDIGSRYYTFAQSMAYAMETAAICGTKVLILDRPNPIDGVTIEGSFLLPECRSFCGYAPVPQRHGLTLGELALLMNKGLSRGGDLVFSPINCSLEIMRVEGWNRSMYLDQTGLTWIIPSPNMPSLETALVYPGACLIEATTISEGRGCTRPFEFIGAPHVDAQKWISALPAEGLELAGASLREISFIPQFQKHAKSYCSGIQVHVLNRKKFRPIRWYLALLFALKKIAPECFSLRTDAYEFLTQVPALDLLWGSDSLRNAIQSGAKASSLEAELDTCESWFKNERTAYLLY